MTSPDMLDWDRIAELREDVGEENFAEVLVLFVEEVAAALDALGVNDQAALAATLHSLKGSAMNIGLSRVGALCLEGEASLRADPLASLDIAEIRSAFDASRTEIADLLV